MASVAEDYLEQDRAVHDFLFVVFVGTHALNIFERLEQFTLNQVQVSAHVHLILMRLSAASIAARELGF